MTNQRKRVMDAVNHRQPDRVPVDFGAMTSSGIHCSVVAELRDHFGLAKELVKAHEPYQMLGYVDTDLAEAMGVDTTCVLPVSTYFGNPIGEWKEWRAPWGQVILIPKDMAVKQLDDGSSVTFPQGDVTALPSGKIPATGYFFDALERQGEYDEDNPDPKDNAEEFGPLSDEALDKVVRYALAARATGRATIAGLPGTTFGSASTVPGMYLKKPKGVRTLVNWYMTMVTHPEFVKEVFSLQADVAIDNIRRIHEAVGDAYDMVMVCGADFGSQRGTLISKESFTDLYCPTYKRVNSWIHANTPWKTFKHCCGAIEPFIEPMIEAEFDILNPVQCSAAGMEAEKLKKRYGDRIVLWGGGVDTQTTLPFGTPAEVREQVLERCRIFSPGGGFVFNSVHNVQARTPLANVLAMLDAVREFNSAGK